MTMTTREAVFLFETLNRIAESEAIKQAPIDVKFLLVRNGRAVQPIHMDFANARRQIMLENSTEKEDAENSDERIATQEQLDFINEQIAKLEETMVEVPIAPIKLSQLENLGLDLVDLNGLYPVIANEEAY